MKLFFVEYKTPEGLTVTKCCSNEKEQSIEYSIALKNGVKPVKYEREL